MKITTSRSKSSETLYICHSFVDKNGRNTSRVCKRLSTPAELSLLLSVDHDSVMVRAREQARTATDEYNNKNHAVSVLLPPTLYTPKNKRRSLNCGYLFLQSIVSSLRPDNICCNIRRRHQYEYNLYDIFSSLTFARVLHPSSKKNSYAFTQALLGQPRYILQNVYRALFVVADGSNHIQAEVYRNSHFLHRQNTKILYYDCTSYHPKIKRESSGKTYGKSREDCPSLIIGTGLFIDVGGFLLVSDLHFGKQNEQKTLKPLEQKVICDFDCAEFIYYSGSGLGLQNNKLFDDMGGRSCVVIQLLKKLRKEDRITALDPRQYRKLESERFIDLKELDENNPEVYRSIYYKEIPIESKELSETMIVTYSPRYEAYQAEI